MGRHAKMQDSSLDHALEQALERWAALLPRVCQRFTDSAPAPAEVQRPHTVDRPAPAPSSRWQERVTIDDHLLNSTLTYLRRGTSGTPEFDDERTQFLLALGRDFRKFGAEAEHYPHLAQSIRQSLCELTGGSPGAAELGELVDLACHLMALGADNDAESGRPATVHATVLQVDRRSPDVTVVRLQMDPPTPWWSGQFIEAQTPYTPHAWRYYSPAIPFNPDGLAELHIRAVGESSRAIAEQANKGDVWIIGASYGHIRASGERPVVMIAGSTGLAPLRALILDLSLLPDPPRVRLFWGARTTAGLYELDSLMGMASAWPWLEVVAISEHLERDASPSHPVRTGTAVEVACNELAAEDNLEHTEILVAGNRHMIANAARALLDLGANPDLLRFDQH